MPHQNNEVPGEFLRLLFSLKGVKQMAAAKKLNVRQQAVSKLIKCKKISAKKFAALITIFNFSAEDIETAKRFLPPPRKVILIRY